MNRKQKLARLEKLAAMLRDHHMAHLKKIAAQREATQHALDQLSKPSPPCADASLFRANQSHLLWANEQKLHLNRALATESAKFIEQRQTTARHHGRAEALAQVLARLGNDKC